MIGGDTAHVCEFITHGLTDLLTPPHDPRDLSDSDLHMLEDARISLRSLANTRKWAEKNLAMGDYLVAYEKLIRQTTKRAR
ncbi:MAG: hypothetical protein EXR05_07275 [Acetobacteraceae bacterium]|nr:hypothetical protein [Acetobacteraceae bacterium]MSP30245.1 hypothetical protein [Acetobacteraceae bacterium]